MTIELNDYDRHMGRLIVDAFGSVGVTAASPGAWIPFAIQVAIETGHGTGIGAVHHNPLNLTVPPGASDPDHYWLGQDGAYSGGSSEEWHTNFAAFATDEDGCRAAATNYLNGSGYADVIAAVWAMDPVAIALAIQGSPWSSDHYGYGLADATAVAVIAESIGGADVTTTLTEHDIREIAKAEARAVLSGEPWIKDAITAAVRDALTRAAAGLAEEASETPATT